MGVVTSAPPPPVAAQLPEQAPTLLFEVLGPEVPLHAFPFSRPQGGCVSAWAGPEAHSLPGDTGARSGGGAAAVPGCPGAAQGSCGAPLGLPTPEPHLVAGRPEGSG